MEMEAAVAESFNFINAVKMKLFEDFPQLPF
jgi:hypothetical protein